VLNEGLVLIVEDNDDDLFILQHAFQKAGITNPVHVARTGKDAIAFLAGADPYSDWNKFPLPSIVLLDLKLPDINGLEVLAWIRKTAGLQALRVAIFTGLCSSKEVEVANDLRVNGFDIKPASLGGWTEMMKNFRVHWLESSRTPQVTRMR